MKILALILARGGSKGIPNKNIVQIGNKPLISYTISHAKQSMLINRIIVSTDSSRIANISKQYGAEIPFLRSKLFSKGSSTTLDTVKHVLRQLENIDYSPDIVALLQPTSPIRPINLLDSAIRKLIRTKSSSVISIKKVKDHPDILFNYNNNVLKPLNAKFSTRSLRQKRSSLFSPTGSVYVFWKKTIEKYDSIYGPKISPIFVKDNQYNIDIDENFDLFSCEMIFKHWKKWKNAR
jgi:CMP-N,N'-diacetyllegionaminic acid synthase